MKNVLITLLLTAAATAYAADSYTVSFMLGTASLRPAGAAAWRPVMLFDRIESGDSLHNEEESRLELIAGDGSMVALNTPWNGNVNRASLASFAAGTDNRSLLKKLTDSHDNSLSEQPVAIAAVRGKTADDGTTAISTTEPETSPESVPEAISGTVTAETDIVEPAEKKDDARKLLEEAVALRARVDRLLQENRHEAASSTLQLAEKLTRQALALLEQE